MNCSKNQVVWARCHLVGLASAIDWTIWSSGDIKAARCSVSARTARKAVRQWSRSSAIGPDADVVLGWRTAVPLMIKLPGARHVQRQSGMASRHSGPQGNLEGEATGASILRENPHPPANALDPD